MIFINEKPITKEFDVLSESSQERRGFSYLQRLKSLIVGSGNTSFRASENGIWLGNAVWSSAPFRVDMDGNVVIAGDVIIGDYAGGQGIFYDSSLGTINFAGITTLKTFIQASIPTSENSGDLWFDSDDSNKPYRAAIAGADQITAGEWVAIDNPTEWADVLDGATTKPSDNATVGATAGTDLKDSGSVTLTDDDVKNIYNFTYGETIAAGQVVCFKKDVIENTSAISIDSYTDNLNATTNYGTAEYLSVGTGDPGDGEHLYNLYFGFNVSDSKPDKVVLKFYGQVQTTGTLYAHRVKASWAEGTITHNVQPSYTAYDETGDPGTVISSTGFQWIEVDITNIVRGQMSTFWDETYGVRLQFDGNVGWINNIRSTEYTGSSTQLPYLMITKGIDLEEDGKVYVADNSDINTANQIIGIAKDSGTVDDVGRVQFNGTITGLSGLTTGRSYYLSTAGGLFLPDTTGTNFQLDFNKTKIGTALSETILQLDIDNERFLWKSEPIHAVATDTSNYVFSPLDANECVIYGEKWSTAEGGTINMLGTIVLKRNGPNSTVMVGDTTNYYITYTWDDTNNKITIYNNLVGASPHNSSSTFYFYK